MDAYRNSDTLLPLDGKEHKTHSVGHSLCTHVWVLACYECMPMDARLHSLQPAFPKPDCNAAHLTEQSMSQ